MKINPHKVFENTNYWKNSLPKLIPAKINAVNVLRNNGNAPPPTYIPSTAAPISNLKNNN